MGAEVLVPVAIAALSTGAQLYNTRRTERRQDAALADSLRRQGAKQRQADARVSEQLAKLEDSRSEEARAKRNAQYLDVLRRGRAMQQAGLTPVVGSATFADDAAAAREAGGALASQRAGLEARIDAPAMQRQDEGFGFGRLATDLALIERESRGDAYIDELRRRAIRRNPLIDAGASLGMGYAAQAAGRGAEGIRVGEPSPYGPYADGYRAPRPYQLPGYLGG